jgi:hypothetical protein
MEHPFLPSRLIISSVSPPLPACTSGLELLLRALTATYHELPGSSSRHRSLPATGHGVPTATRRGLPAAGLRRAASHARRLPAAAAAGPQQQQRQLLERMVRTSIDLML